MLHSNRRLFQIFVVVVLMLVSFSVDGTRLNRNGAIPLKAPAFVNVAYAANDPSAAKAATALQDEAGISAYFNKGSSINLNLVRGLYRTIEVDNGSYILGSMQATGTNNYPEAEDVHVYVSATGWVMAYYLNTDPASKIIDVLNYNGGTTINTKLEIVLGRVSTAISAGNPAVSFYDFRNPNATKLLLVTDLSTVFSSDSFQINLPGTSFTYFEESWTTGNLSCCSSMLLDGVALSGSVSGNNYGVISPQLGVDQNHTFLVQAGGSTTVEGLAVEYRDVP